MSHLTQRELYRARAHEERSMKKKRSGALLRLVEDGIGGATTISYQDVSMDSIAIFSIR